MDEGRGVGTVSLTGVPSDPRSLHPAIERNEMARTPWEIPKWFDLAKFSYLESYKAEQWWKAIHCLASIYRMPPEVLLQKRQDAFEGRSDSDFLAWIMGHLLNGGELHDAWKEMAHNEFPPTAPIRYDHEKLCFGSVESISVGTVAGMAAELEKMPMGPLALAIRMGGKAVGRQLRKIARKRESAPVDYKKVREFMQTPYVLAMKDSGRKVVEGSEVGELEENANNLPWLRTLHVNLGVPDAQIKRDFEEWLRQVRSIHSPVVEKDVIKPEEYKSWVDDRIVPLAFLMIWRRLTSNQLSWAAIQRAVYWDTNVSEASVKRTYAERVERILTASTVRALYVQAEREGLSRKLLDKTAPD